jgi:ABC-type molybdenum transport system ATPase subunit/photorepair protein PhrA
MQARHQDRFLGAVKDTYEARPTRVSARSVTDHISEMAVLSLVDIAVECGATTLLRDVTCTVEAGERWGIVGRNDSGKTTLFRLVEGTLEPSRGIVTRAPGRRVDHRDRAAEHRTDVDAAAVGGV